MRPRIYIYPLALALIFIADPSSGQSWNEFSYDENDSWYLWCPEIGSLVQNHYYKIVDQRNYSTGSYFLTFVALLRVTPTFSLGGQPNVNYDFTKCLCTSSQEWCDEYKWSLQ